MREVRRGTCQEEVEAERFCGRLVCVSTSIRNTRMSYERELEQKNKISF